MALPNPDHPSFGTRPALFGLPSLPRPGTSPLTQALAAGDPTLTVLAPMVGGADALEALHTDPLAALEPDWTAVDEPIRRRALETIALVDGRAGTWLGGELREVARRLVARSASVDATAFAKGPVDRTAAALTWLAVMANGLTRRDRALPPSLVWSLFGVTNCTARGRALYAGLGLAPPLPPSWFAPAAASTWLADPAFLVGATRSYLCAVRDSALRNAERRRAEAPVSVLDGRRVQLRARPYRPAWAFRATADTGRDFVAVAFDGGTEQPHLIALSVPEARELVQMLGDALDAPVRTRR